MNLQLFLGALLQSVVVDVGVDVVVGAVVVVAVACLLFLLWHKTFEHSCEKYKALH